MRVSFESLLMLGEFMPGLVDILQLGQICISMLDAGMKPCLRLFVR